MIVLTSAIFIADTVTDLEIAAAVFYIAVVLLAIGPFRERGVTLVSVGCMVLTILSYFLTRSGSLETGPINCMISLIAIAATARLGLRMAAATNAMNEARAQLTHVARITSLGELAVSIAHEVNQPLTAIMTSGGAGLRWLGATPPNVEKARATIERMVSDASLASEVIVRVRQLAKRTPLKVERMDVNAAILEVVALTRSELDKNRVTLQLQLANDLHSVPADKVQIQQVVLNLLLNAIDALKPVAAARRELAIGTMMGEDGALEVMVTDSGDGLDPSRLESVFDAFQTSKPDGMGMGLTISRSIVDAHGGRIWAERAQPRGTTFRFSLPREGAEV